MSYGIGSGMHSTLNTPTIRAVLHRMFPAMNAPLPLSPHLAGRRSNTFVILAMFLVGLFLIAGAHAQSGVPNTSGNPDTNPGGSLTDVGDGTDTMTWNTGTTDASYTAYNLATAIFNGGTVTNGTITANTFTAYSGQVGSALIGSGTLTKTTAGTLTLTGTNTYSGGTTVSDGTLQVGNGSTGSLVGNITNNAVVDFQSPGDTTFGGVISGTGNVVQNGGIFRFSSAQTYTGATTINSGYLVLPNSVNQALAASTAVDVATGANFDISNGSHTIAGLTGGGSVYSFGGSAGHLTVATPDGQSQEFSGNLGGLYADFALTKSGSGTLNLSGDSSYTGDTTVSVGTLLVNGSLDATHVSVSDGATLGGSGTFFGLATITSGAHLAPGNSPGTIIFGDGLTLATGSILDLELGTVSDLISITSGVLTGSLDTGGITINLSNSGGFEAGFYTLIDFNPEEDTIALSNFDLTDFVFGNTIADYTYSLDFVDNTLQLTSVAVPEPSTCALGALALGAALLRRRRRS